MTYLHERKNIDIAWCPGCGNFGIRQALMRALEELEVPAAKLVVASGIGQAPKTPHYILCNCFNGLHGRALPAATAIKACSPGLTVMAQGGDGDMYGEGGNHFLHCIRRNPDLTHLVHDNMVYGLTKGQASPTSMEGFETPVQPEGVTLRRLDPVALAISQDAPFVARSLAGDLDHLSGILVEAISFRGYALVDVLQPCVSFNRVNDYAWFEENTRELPEGYDPTDRQGAMARALEEGPMNIGVLYRNDSRKTFGDAWDATSGGRALHGRRPDGDALLELMRGYVRGDDG